LGWLSTAYKAVKWGSLAISIIDPDIGTEIHEKLSDVEDEVVATLDSVEETIKGFI
jgi:hypothetical protein